MKITAALLAIALFMFVSQLKTPNVTENRLPANQPRSLR